MRASTGLGSLLAALLVVSTTGIGALTAPAGAQAAPLKVLILGDSYSVGNGTGENYSGPADCYRSADVWGQQAAKTLAANLGRTAEVTNRASSGGVTSDFTHARYMGTFEAGVTNWRFHSSVSDAIKRAQE